MEKSGAEILWRLGRKKLKVSGNSTFSTEFPAGHSPSKSRTSPKTNESLRGPAPAKDFPPPASKKGSTTRAISGPTCSGSEASRALTSGLVNRLQRRLNMVGSIEYNQTWKQKITPLGIVYWAHIPSARTIYVNVSTGELRLVPFASPRQTDGKCGGTYTENCEGKDLAKDATLCGWDKTPMASDGDGGVMEIRPGTTGKYKLRDFAQLAGFPTALVNDALGSTHCYGKKVDGEDRKIFLKLPGAARLAGFPTTRAADGSKGQRTPAGMERERERRGKPPDDLPSVVLMASWPTTNAVNSKGSYENPELITKIKAAGYQTTLQDAVQSANLRGTIAGLFHVRTGERVVLHPLFSLWLMLGQKAETWAKAAPGYAAWSEMQAVLESGC